ncbi:hypothetical protein FHS40_000473 [Streptomyces spectabilis]|uniref:Uncharacterized protein n=1 Tax=Streptomyces spectabilis TaxID=68270 RepID=A0A7W8AQE3_STRST|nr:hypothetical protein [Streptomyces spectabilis]
MRAELAEALAITEDAEHPFAPLRADPLQQATPASTP